MKKGYYKKVDRSMMDWGFTIPNNFIDDFLGGQNLELGTSREITMTWDNKKYKVKICHVKSKKLYTSLPNPMGRQ